MQGFFRYLDILVFVEATIYAVDEANESLAKLSMNPKHAHMEGKPIHPHTGLKPCGSDSHHNVITLLTKQHPLLRLQGACFMGKCGLVVFAADVLKSPELHAPAQHWRPFRQCWRASTCGLQP